MRNVFVFVLLLIVVNTTFSQVNMQTGSAVYSLPMFQWQDAISRLNAFVNLSYNSGSGLKTNSVAMNVGEGWNLQAGGVITRMQIGEPDDQIANHGNGTIEDESKYPPGYLYSSLSPEEGCPGALTKYPLFGDQNHIYKQHNLVGEDREQDHFSFQFNGRNGLFILEKDNDVGYLLGDSKIIIWFVRNQGSNPLTRTVIGTFYIRDENGLVYKFDKHELAKSLKTSPCDWDLSQQYSQPERNGGGVYHEANFDNSIDAKKFIINSWYLTEINDPLTSRKITFSYEIRSINSYAGAGISYYKEKDYSIVTHARSVTQTPVLSSINFPDGHQISLNYGANRLDLTGDKALASVDIKYGTRYLSKYELNTSYFILNRIGTPSSDFQKKNARLCLTSVQRYGVDLKDAEQPYLFEYYLGTNGTEDFVPPPYSPIKDVWGYYNGDLSKNAAGQSLSNYIVDITKLDNSTLKGLCFLRNGNNDIVLNPKNGYAKNGLLKRIVFPEGKSLAYEYEQNRGTFMGSKTQIMIGGVRVSRTKQTDGGYDNNCDNPIIVNYKYNLNGSDTSSLWGNEMPITHVGVAGYYGPEKKHVYYKPLLKFGCDYKFKYPGILSRDQFFSITGHQQFMQTLSKVLDVVSSVMTVIDIVSVCLKATPAAIVAVVLDFIAAVVNVVLTCFTNPSKDSFDTIYYDSDLNGANPLPSQFKRVEVWQTGNGRSVYEFTSDEEYPLWEINNPLFSHKQRFAYWAYGMPLRTTIYDNTNNIVKQIENVYNYNLAKYYYGHPGFITYQFPNCKCVVKKSTSQRSVDWSNVTFYADPNSYVKDAASNPNLMAEIYDYFSGRVLLEKTFERIYKSGTLQFQEIETQFGYNNRNYLVSEINTIQSDGANRGKTFSYSIDYSGGVFDVLASNGIINVPISVRESIYKRTSPTSIIDFFLNEKVTELALLDNGDIKPVRILEQRPKQPAQSWVPVIEWIAYIPNNPNNINFYKEVQTFSYDNLGYMRMMKDEGGHVVSNIYDYNNKYIVASIINADIEIDKPAYSSFETSESGGWVINGPAVYSNNYAVTGERSLILSSSNSISKNIGTGKAYKLSFWADNGSLNVVGNATLKISEPLINGFTYYEYYVNSGTTSVSINGNAKIDELRIIPQDARIRTVTYDALIGKTSECDENNRITYYEYDSFGRLRFIKDEHKNIIKMHEYNYATNLQKTCPNIYSNPSITEIFIKDNCGANYIGTEVIYNIPAGKYTSTISQDIVDNQVEDELYVYGQAFANANGSCIQVFKNIEKSEVFYKQGCEVGYKGTAATYTVPAGRYSSIISQVDADSKALIEMKSNGQAFANTTGNATCVIDYEPVWENEGEPQFRCQTNSSGFNTGNQEILVTDINPNSSSFGQTVWQNIGSNSSACPISCNSSNCSGVDKKCINGVCETGVMVFTKCVNTSQGSTRTYHYLWSDGSKSINYTQDRPVPCPTGN